MKPKHARLRFLLGSIVLMSAAVALILYALRDNMVFFYTPSQLIAKQESGGVHPAQGLRIGGLVKMGSVKNLEKGGIQFVVTDLQHEVLVRYQGLLPSLFREGQGVVAQGRLSAEHSFDAETILAKHDENYMPREVVEQLKASGRWKDGRMVK